MLSIAGFYIISRSKKPHFWGFFDLDELILFKNFQGLKNFVT